MTREQTKEELAAEIEAELIAEGLIPTIGFRYRAGEAWVIQRFGGPMRIVHEAALSATADALGGTLNQFCIVRP